MRIATQQQYLNSIDHMQRSSSKIAELAEQAATGKILQTPSDDPVAAAQVVKLERSLAQYEKFNDNISVTERRLQLEETILDDVYTATTRMKELTIKAGNLGTLSDSDRSVIATELYELADYVAGLMNTQDSQGEYLFAGSKGSTRPYEPLANGHYSYHGDDGQRLIQVGTQQYVPSNDSGETLFQSVDSRLQVNMTGETIALGTPFISIPPVAATYTEAFANIEAETEYQEATRGLGDISITVLNDVLGGTGLQYKITDSGGNELVPYTNFVSGDTVEFNGLSFDLSSTGVVDDVETSITLSTYSEKINVLDVAVNLADALKNSSKMTSEELSEIIATTLDQLEQAGENNLESTAAVGTRLKSLENISSTNLDFELYTKTALSQLVDADMASVISQYKLQETTLEAAQAVFGRVSQLSLFNYIN